MTDLSQMLRWNANFVRGLAQSVLERAKVIRSTLTPSALSAGEPTFTVQTKGGKKAKLTVKKSPRKAAKKAIKTARKTKRTNA